MVHRWNYRLQSFELELNERKKLDASQQHHNSFRSYDKKCAYVLQAQPNKYMHACASRQALLYTHTHHASYRVIHIRTMHTYIHTHIEPHAHTHFHPPLIPLEWSSHGCSPAGDALGDLPRKLRALCPKWDVHTALEIVSCYRPEKTR